MKASIIVVNYNLARFLRVAIESALGQTYRNTEVIVVDDGSTDQSAEVIKSFGNLIVCIFKENGGQSSCYKSGLAVASGDLVLYLDGDDFLYPRCIEEVVKHWKSGCVKAHFYLDIVDEQGGRLNALTPSGRLTQGKDALKMMRFFGAYCSPPASGNVFSRYFLRKIFTNENAQEYQRFDQEMHFGVDAVPIFSAPYFGEVAAIPLVLGSYRRHANASGGVTSCYQARTSLENLRKEYTRDLLRDRAWQRAASETKAFQLREPSRLKRHLCYLRLARSGLDPADHRFSLVLKGISSSLLWSGYSWRQKFAMSGWFVLTGILPLQIAKILIRPALAISNRPGPLKKFLQIKTQKIYAVS